MEKNNDDDDLNVSSVLIVNFGNHVYEEWGQTVYNMFY